MKRLLICLTIMIVVLTGCADEKDAQPVGSASDEPVEAPAEVSESEPAVESEEEVKEPQVSDDMEEVSEAEEVAPNDLSFENSLAEYLESLDRSTYEVERNWGYKKSRFYADDINGDGYPEVCQYLENGLTATIKDMALAVFTVERYWDEEKNRWAYDAAIPFTSQTRHNSAESFGSDKIILSYTRGAENILMHYETCRGDQSVQTTYDEVKIFRDGEMLHNGYATREVTAYSTVYIIVAPDFKQYKDEEHYNSFDRGSDYETVIEFSADEGWTTLQDALDHPGELP